MASQPPDPSRALALGLLMLMSAPGCRMDNPAFDPGRESKGEGETRGESESAGSEGHESESESETGGETETGDGDGDPGTSSSEGEGEGDGDGDGDTSPECGGVMGFDECTICIAGSCCTPEATACLAEPKCLCVLQCLGNNFDELTCQLECMASDQTMLNIAVVASCAASNCEEPCQQP